MPGGEVVVPQHVHHADRGQAGAEQLGPLGHGRADQQPAVAAALNGQLWGEVYFSSISHSAAAMKSSNTFCLLSFLPA